MATNEWDNDDDFEFDGVDGDGSDLVKKLRKAKRADEKRIKELSDQLENLTKAEKERVVKNILAQKGVNEKAARYALKDLEEVNENTVSDWLDTNGDLFGYSRAQEITQEQAIDRAALRQQDVVTQGALPPDKYSDSLMRIQNAETAEEIINMIYSGEF